MSEFEHSQTGGGLAGARRAAGWSQTQAALRLSELAVATGISIAAPGSLKSLLSRWENGHAIPDPQYRELLIRLYGCPAAELGLPDPDAEAGGRRDGTDRAATVRTSVAAAASLEAGDLAAAREQLELHRRIDDRLGAAGTHLTARAHTDHLTRLLRHTVGIDRRRAVAAVLAEAAELSATHDLDRARPDEAWAGFATALAAAREAGVAEAAEHAVAGLAETLIDANDPAAALNLLDDVVPDPLAGGTGIGTGVDPEPTDRAHGPGIGATRRLAATLRLAAARAAATAALATSDADVPVGALTAPFGQIDLSTGDLGGIRFEVADLHRWHGHALTTLGASLAPDVLRRALDAPPRSARTRAELHTDLAVALGGSQPEQASAHARAAHELSTRIGADRLRARLSRLGVHGRAMR